jgi:hypothetical protein
MKRLYYIILLASISIFTFNCQKELSNSRGIPGIGNNNTNPITATLQGNIVDENGQPAAGVMVKVGTKTATTNARGYFRITNAALDKNASLVTAEKTGYFKAYRSFSATSGTNHVSVKLIKKVSAGTIDASSGGNVTLANGAKIALPANGVVKAAGGSAYTGNITVNAAYIDPTADDISQTVPGSFMADDKNGKRVVLASYGMLAIELESASGEKLQIASGSTATLTTPIPSSLQSSAPATIALWYVNEETGVWKEEGTATKNGTNYIGEVEHFSFWNCDVNAPAINLSLTLKNNEGVPIVHGLVKLTRVGASAWSEGYGITDSLGQVCGLVPINETLMMQVLDPCNNAVFTQNIGPFSANTNLGVITVVNPASTSILTIRGQLNNCGNTAVTNGYALINYDNVTRYAAVNNSGEFTVSFLKCSGGSTTCEIIGVDAATNQQGTATTVTITTPVTNAGNIVACGVSAAQFINYTVDGTNYSLTSAGNDSLASYTYVAQATDLSTWMMGLRPGNGDNVSFSFGHSAATGTYNIQSLSVQNFDSLTVVAPSTVTLTSYPASAGGFYEGSFTGKFKNIASPVITHNINGTFRVRRL